MAAYKLTYFNARGSAELIRLIFAQTGITYEDQRLTSEEWAVMKPNTPFGTLPVLEVDGKQITGTLPIARYVAESHNLAGSGLLENTLMASTADAVQDLWIHIWQAKIEKNDTRRVELEADLNEKHIPKLLCNLEKQACEGGWMFGSRLCWADLHVFLLLDHLLVCQPRALDNYPSLAKLTSNVERLPRIAEWLEKRPVTAL